jgi:hypothetical protein
MFVGWEIASLPSVARNDIPCDIHLQRLLVILLPNCAEFMAYLHSNLRS